MTEIAQDLQGQETDLTPTKPLMDATQLVVQDDSALALLLDSAKFNQAWRAATAFAKSKLVPVHFQGSTENCFVALVLAEQLNLAPFMVMNKTYVVHGRPGMEAQLVIALVNARGPFTGPIQWRFHGEGNSRGCTAFAIHAKTGQTCEATVDWKLVEAEGWNQDTKRRDGTSQKSKWNTMERMMFMYRSATFLARLYCPEVLMGLSTVDELQDIEVIDAQIIPSSNEPHIFQTEKLKEEIKSKRSRSPKASEPPSTAPEPGTGATGQEGKEKTATTTQAATFEQRQDLEKADRENPEGLKAAWVESGVNPAKLIPDLTFDEADAILGSLR